MNCYIWKIIKDILINGFIWYICNLILRLNDTLIHEQIIAPLFD